MNPPLLQAEALVKHYPVRGGLLARRRKVVRAVQEVSFELVDGETLGLVGESGCGKSTLGRTVLFLEPPTDGEVRFRGRSLTRCSRREMFELRRDFQMIFQDPYSSLNPRLTIGEIIQEPLDIHRIGSQSKRRDQVVDLLLQVGLESSILGRYPHEFSGGQRQRIGIARALALQPKMIVADEPLSALDVSVQAQVINLMVALQKAHDLAYLFISHDLSLVEYISDRIAVMYLGRIVETGPKAEVFTNPRHPYTRALMASVPDPNPRKRRHSAPVQGETPSALDPPGGCAFHPRCPFAIDECRRLIPELKSVDATHQPDHLTACIRAGELPAERAD